MKTKLALALILAFFSPLALAAGAASIDAIVAIVVWLVVVAVIFWMIWWFIGYVGVPEPFNKVLRVLVGLAAFVIVLYLLVGLLPPMPGSLR